MDFKNKRILITGAGQGIGRELVKELYKHEAIILAVSRTISHLESLKSECPVIKTVQIDLSDWSKTKTTISSICPVDILINNAGVSNLENFGDITEENWDKLFAVNVKAVVNVSQVVANAMKEHKIQGSIVNVSSVASKNALQGHTSYCSSKAALDAITRNMAFELGKYNIRVNSVQPTVVMTQMGQIAWGDPKKSEPILNKIPLNRFAEAKEVVDVILFLIDSKSSMVNGVHIPIDGGYLIN